MRIKCSTCGDRVAMGWLFLGLPWSKYTCGRCGSVYAGTLPRLLAISVSTGILGYVLFGAIKGKVSPLWLPLPLALTLAVLFLDLPMQVKRNEAPAIAPETDENHSEDVDLGS